MLVTVTLALVWFQVSEQPAGGRGRGVAARAAGAGQAAAGRWAARPSRPPHPPHPPALPVLPRARPAALQAYHNIPINILATRKK